MANFPTHIAVGTVARRLSRDGHGRCRRHRAGEPRRGDARGLLGSVLPDIDLKDSRPSKAFFAGLAIFFSFAVLFHFAPHLSIPRCWSCGSARCCSCASPCRSCSPQATIAASGIRCGGGRLLACDRRHLPLALGRPDGVAWLAAGFLGIGYLVHLTLDEIYSVDVLDAHLKKSFGTALKLFDYKHYGHSIAMAVATVLVLLVTPPTKVFVENITSPGLWTELHQRLLPQENKWFRGMAWLLDGEPGAKAGTVPAGASPIATGSIVPSAPPSEETKEK